MKSFLDDAIACLTFYSRLPIPWSAAARGEPPQFKRAARAVWLAGAAIGALPALVLVVALRIGFDPSLASLGALTTLVVETGALHEDGLADAADAFGAGGTRERKLEIMKDSRIGAFGALALILSMLWRWRALATLAGASPAGAALALIGAAAASRAIGLLPLALLDPARATGLGASVGKPSWSSLAAALGAGALVGFAPAIFLGAARPAAGLVAASLAAAAVARLSERHFGGVTGDVAGAAQQFAEIAYLGALAVGLG